MVTGEEARNLADKEATNMAVCNSGGLRVREEGVWMRRSLHW